MCFVLALSSPPGNSHFLMVSRRVISRFSRAYGTGPLIVRNI